MIAVLWLVIAALVTWRITSLIAQERGPFAVGTRLRSLFGVHHEPEDNGAPAFNDSGEVLLNSVFGNRIDDFLHEIARGLTCMWCCSVWIGALIALTPPLKPLVADVWTWGGVALALSALTILIEALRERLSR